VKHALRQLLGDFLSAILFLVVYALSGDRGRCATGVGAKLVVFALQYGVFRTVIR